MLETESASMFEKPWLAWAFIIVGNLFKWSSWEATRQNCYLVSCDWISPTAIVLGAMALIAATMWWLKTNVERRSPKTKFLEGAAVSAQSSAV